MRGLRKRRPEPATGNEKLRAERMGRHGGKRLRALKRTFGDAFMHRQTLPVDAERDDASTHS
jgi:hypothetical protein